MGLSNKGFVLQDKKYNLLLVLGNYDEKLSKMWVGVAGEGTFLSEVYV